MQNTKLYRFLIHQKWAVAGFIISAIATVSLTFNNLAEAIYFDDPRHQNVELRAWMTPRYITLSYNLPRPVVLELLNLDEHFDHSKRLDVIAENLGLTLDELTSIVRKTAASYGETSND